MYLYIDTDAVVVYTNKLEKLRRSALPMAIRETLNSAAFDVKMKTMPESAGTTFVSRQPNFFKANSRVEMAKGFDIGTMKSIVGFTDEHLRNKSTNFAIQELQQQEEGGTIERRSFISMNEARLGQSPVKNVRPSARLSSIKGIVNSNLIKGSKKSAFVRAAMKAGRGGYVIGNTAKQTLWKIRSISKNDKGINIAKEALYSYKKGRSVHVGQTHFMQRASNRSANRLNEFYIKAATKQFERALK